MELWLGEGMIAHPMDLAFGGGWIREECWPPVGAERAVFRLGRRSSGGVMLLVAADEGAPAEGGHDTDQSDDANNEVFEHCSPLECGMGGGEWCPRDGGGEGPEYQADQTVDDALSLTFDLGAPLEQPLTLLGAAVVTLRLSVDQPLGMVAVRLNEVRPDGGSSRVTYGLLNLAHRHSSSDPSPMVPGRVETVTLRLNDAAYRFSAGCRLRLAISTSYWPMAWPTNPHSMTTLSLHTAGSRLALPLRPNPRVASEGGGSPFEVPEFSAPHPVREVVPPDGSRTWRKDMASGEMVLEQLMDNGVSFIEDIGLNVGKKSMERYSITEGQPGSALAETRQETWVERGDWRPRTVSTIVLSGGGERGEGWRLVANLRAYEGEVLVLERTWDETVPRDLL